MRKVEKEAKRQGVLAEFDPDRDYYPDLNTVIQSAFGHEDWPTGKIERFEVTCLANGQGTWRVWPARGDEFVGGVYTDSDVPAP